MNDEFADAFAQCDQCVRAVGLRRYRLPDLCSQLNGPSQERFPSCHTLPFWDRGDLGRIIVNLEKERFHRSEMWEVCLRIDLTRGFSSERHLSGQLALGKACEEPELSLSLRPPVVQAI